MTGIEDCYKNLALVIVKKALSDYVIECKKLAKNPENTYAMHNKSQIERFFHSPWYSLMCDVDPDYLMQLGIKAKFKSSSAPRKRDGTV